MPLIIVLNLGEDSRKGWPSERKGWPSERNQQEYENTVK